MNSILTWSRERLPDAGWEQYLKIGATKMAPINGPCTVETTEGPYELDENWRGYLALDQHGNPYPVVADPATGWPLSYVQLS